MKTTEDLFEEVSLQDRAEINRLTKMSQDLLADSKRWETLAKDRLRMLEASKDTRESLDVFNENVGLRERIRELEKEARRREKFISLCRTHVLNKRLGKLGLHNQNQKGFKEYKQLVDALDVQGMLFPPHAGNYSQRLVMPKKVYRFDEYMDKNWRDTYTIKVDHYSNRGIHRFLT